MKDWPRHYLRLPDCQYEGKRRVAAMQTLDMRCAGPVRILSRSFSNQLCRATSVACMTTANACLLRLAYRAVPCPCKRSSLKLICSPTGVSGPQQDLELIGCTRSFTSCAYACAESSLHLGVKATFTDAGGLGDWPCSPDRSRGQSPLLSCLHRALQPAAGSCTWTGARVVILLVRLSGISLFILVSSAAFWGSMHNVADAGCIDSHSACNCCLLQSLCQYAEQSLALPGGVSWLDRARGHRPMPG